MVRGFVVTCRFGAGVAVSVFGILSGIVLFLHLLWIFWVILGWLVTRNRPLLRWLHIISLVYGIVIEVGPWPCSLTIAEQWLQTSAGATPYRGSFLIHYLEALVYPDVPQELLTWVGSGVCLLNLWIYGMQFWREWRAERADRVG